MNDPSAIRAFLRAHCARYPALTLQDVCKALYQSAFGCEHLIADPSAAADFIRAEAESSRDCAPEQVEPLCGDYCRVHLGVLRDGLRAETLAQLFARSARHEELGRETLEAMLRVLQEMADALELPFSARETAEKDRVLVAVEGGSASGKTTLGALLQSVYACPVFHMDDFFLRPEQRTAARFSEPGGNVDRERFLSEVLLPLREGKCVDYRRFDCATFTIAPPEKIEPGRLGIVEGAYSMHPDLAPYYDLSVFLDISAEKQRGRILKRNAPAHAQQFFDRWIPFEQRYFDALDVKERCDLVLSADD